MHDRPIVAFGMSSVCQRPTALVIFAYPVMEFWQYVLSPLLSKTFKIGLAQGPFI